MSRLEAIDYLARNNLPISETSIANVISNGFELVKPNISNGDTIDRNFFIKLQESVVQSFSDTSEKTENLFNQYSSLTDNVLDRLEKLYRDIESAYVDVQMAAVTEQNMSGYTKTLNLDFSDPALTNTSITTATISGGTVLGLPVNSLNADQKMITVKPIFFRFVKTYLKSVRGESPATLQKINEDGSIQPITELESYPIINSQNPFNIYGVSSFKDSHKIDFYIDRESEEPFNQIEINLYKAEIINIYASDDGLIYKKLFDENVFVKNTVLPVKPCKARFLKIVFHKAAPSHFNNGKSVFEVKVKSINILKSTIDETTVFCTNDIQVNGQYTSIAIDACDSAFQKNTTIQYEICINDKEWQQIRPSNVYKQRSVFAPVALRTNDFSHNKIISLKSHSKTENGYLFDVEIPSEFLRSNTTKYFSSDITNTAKDWILEKGYRSVFGLLYSKKDFDFKDRPIEINGKWVEGKITLTPGLYKIRTFPETYANPFITKNATYAGNGYYNVFINESKDPVLLYDPIHPNNHKILIEQNFDFVFQKEIKERTDFLISKSENGLQICSFEKHEEIAILYMLNTSDVFYVKLKATLSSIDKNTVPYIGKLMMRLA